MSRRGNSSTEMILGVDENGATIEGLRHTMNIVHRAYVFHDPSVRTFHPKLYVVESDTSAIAIVGSGNMTRGGLYTNYEAAAVVEVHDKSTDAEGVEFIAGARRYFETLLGTDPACQPLTEENLERLLGDESLNILSEARRNRQRAEARRGTSRDREQSMFGTGIKGLSGAPAPTMPPVEADEEDSDSGVQVAPFIDETTDERSPAPTSEEATDVGPTGVLGFFKQLGKFDVSPGGAPGQIIIPRRFVDFFPPMDIEQDETARGGPRRSGVRFPLTFVDGDDRIEVEDARAILYQPAADHPRQNIELRFTFRNRDVFDRLALDDALVFRRDESGGITVERQPSGAMGPGRYGWL
jgi:hypothetical protein